MSVRILLLKLMVAGPAVFLLAVILGARTRQDEYRFPSYSKDQQRSFEQYLPITRDTARLLAFESTDAPPSQIRALAARWCEEWKSGLLRPMTPLALDDTVREGSKSQIFGVYCLLVSKMTALSMVEAEHKQVDQAAQDLLLSLRLAEVMKYNDFSSVMTCALEQRRLLTVLKGLKIASPAVRAQALRVLKQFELGQRPLGQLASTMRRVHAEARVRRGDDPVAALDAKRLFSPPILSAFEHGEVMAIQASAREIAHQNRDPQYTELVAEVQLGFSGQRRLEHLVSVVERQIEFDQAGTRH